MLSGLPRVSDEVLPGLKMDFFQEKTSRSDGNIFGNPKFYVQNIYIYHKMIIRVYYIISHDTVDACEILHQFVDGLSPYNPISQQVRPFVRVFLLFSLHRICADTLMVIIFIKNLFLLVKMDRHFYICGNMRVWHHARKSLVTNNHMN